VTACPSTTSSTTPRRFPRSLALSTAAVAAPSAGADPLAQERYYQSYQDPRASQGTSPEERYYASYGDPRSLSRPPSGAPSDKLPWLPIAGAVMLAAGGATQLRRVRILHRRTARVTAS
jgi:hypothetical protein